jgi:hypothetical protein
MRTDARTGMRMEAEGGGRATFEIGASADGAVRAWVVRLHLLPERRRHVRRRRAAGCGRTRLPRPDRPDVWLTSRPARTTSASAAPVACWSQQLVMWRQYTRLRRGYCLA